MRAAKRKTLENCGWKIGSASEFLGLSPPESIYIEMKLALSNAFRKQLLKKKMSMAELAKAIDSRQSQIAKMEAGDPGVSIDLLLKSLLALEPLLKNLQRQYRPMRKPHCCQAFNHLMSARAFRRTSSPDTG